MSKSNIIPSQCQICAVPAIHSYYGVIACGSCKMFFKRNAENRTKTLKCHFDGQCEVNINTRHVCAACRLEKCFQVGMCVESIRCSQTHRKKNNTASLALDQMSIQNNTRSQMIRTLNLLEQDQASLTTNQWTLLSNLIHSYDEHNALATAQNFMNEINSLHPKLRFKIDARKIVEFVTVLSQTIEPFIQSNQHFTSLPRHDRSIVLRGAVDNVTCLASAFIMRQSDLINNSAFRNGLEITYGTIPYQLSLKVISLVDQDVDLVKLTLSIFAFCTNCCTVFNENTSHTYLRDIQSLLNIQNMYAEVIWKYLLYKYKFEQAVIRFTHLIRTIIGAITVRTLLQTVQNHTDVVETLVNHIEQEQTNINDE
ncbi:unnamed protein product [Rotaria sp. Silwood1]|nr:unnamed protein product [Rotaria sp. Silwood1]CAF4773539.1 unnamed protein product [Rotaria sp. Silwood1]